MGLNAVRSCVRDPPHRDPVPVHASRAAPRSFFALYNTENGNSTKALPPLSINSDLTRLALAATAREMRSPGDNLPSQPQSTCELSDLICVEGTATNEVKGLSEDQASTRGLFVFADAEAEGSYDRVVLSGEGVDSEGEAEGGGSSKKTTNKKKKGGGKAGGSEGTTVAGGSTGFGNSTAAGLDLELMPGFWQVNAPPPPQ